MTNQETRERSAAEWTASVLEGNGGLRDDGHWHAEHCVGVPAYPCECILIENEMADYRMVMRHCSEIYDEVSGGRVSKPNTLPSVVLDFMQERQQKEIDEAVDAALHDAVVERDALANAVRALLFYHDDAASFHEDFQSPSFLRSLNPDRAADYPTAEDHKQWLERVLYTPSRAALAAYGKQEKPHD